MYISSFEWDERNAGHIARHKVMPFEVEDAILLSKPLFQRKRDGRYAAYSTTDEGRYLIIVFVFKQLGRIRVITARDMIDRERKYYKKRKA